MLKRARGDFKLPKPVSRSRIEELFISDDEEPEAEHDVTYAPSNNEVVNNVRHSSSTRRPVIDQGKMSALRLAMAVKSSEGFLMVMKPSHVYKKFFMNIPCMWMTKNLHSLLNYKVVLRVDNHTWPTKFVYCKHNGRGGFSAGWKDFAENELQEFDVCMFEPVNPWNNSVILDVTVFHVGQCSPTATTL